MAFPPFYCEVSVNTLTQKKWAELPLNPDAGRKVRWKPLFKQTFHDKTQLSDLVAFEQPHHSCILSGSRGKSKRSCQESGKVLKYRYKYPPKTLIVRFQAFDCEFCRLTQLCKKNKTLDEISFDRKRLPYEAATPFNIETQHTIRKDNRGQLKIKLS